MCVVCVCFKLSCAAVPAGVILSTHPRVGAWRARATSWQAPRTAPAMLWRPAAIITLVALAAVAAAALRSRSSRRSDAAASTRSLRRWRPLPVLPGPVLPPFGPRRTARTQHSWPPPPNHDGAAPRRNQRSTPVVTDKERSSSLPAAAAASRCMAAAPKGQAVCQLRPAPCCTLQSPLLTPASSSLA